MPRDTDRLIAPIWRGMTPEERRAYLTDLQAGCEQRIETLEAQIKEQEIIEKKAATAYWARAQIFEKPSLDGLAETVREAKVQIEAFQDEIFDLYSLVLLCREELAKHIASSRHN